MVLCIIIGVVAGGSFCRLVFVNFKIASFVLLLFCQTSIVKLSIRTSDDNDVCMSWGEAVSGARGVDIVFRASFGVLAGYSSMRPPT